VKGIPCRGCIHQKRCTRTIKTCVKYRTWREEAFRAIHSLSKTKKPPPEPASDFCMRRHCQWANEDGLCVFPCMEPGRRLLASRMQEDNREICREAHKRERQRRQAEKQGCPEQGCREHTCSGHTCSGQYCSERMDADD